MTPETRVSPFAAHHQTYDDWFIRHEAVYVSELLAVRTLTPYEGQGLEIGVGTARFAGPLGTRFGIDPAQPTLEYARSRDVTSVCGIAEALPFADAVFDYALIVCTICFVDDAQATLNEAARVLRPGGCVIVGFIDRNSATGKEYLARQSESVFYRDAHFFSASDVGSLLHNGGFGKQTWLQTLTAPLARMTAIEAVRSGSGEGAFLVVSAPKK